MDAQGVETVARHRCFDGDLLFCQHRSAVCASPVPVLYWLSGLTCTDENFMMKSGAQGEAARLGLALVAPDTSPRNTGIPDEDRDWDLGSGAGFYVDATQAPWAQHYQMQSWVTQELPGVIRTAFPIDGRREAVSGHSMGGHGALVCALRNPDRYRSVSAFAPICAPTRCPWGQKALTAYLGPDQAGWSRYDASLLMERTGGLDELLVDQGGDDEFLAGQLMPERLEEACAAAGCTLTLRYQAGYDHSYYFIASYIADHLRWHAERLS